MGNAVKFTKNGHILIELQVVELDNENLSLHTVVKDTGIGIEKENYDKIFNKFSQLENNNKNHGKTSFYEEDEDEKNSQHNPSFSELEPNDVSDFEDNYNNDDDYGIECDYSHNDYEVNEDYPEDQYYNDDADHSWRNWIYGVV